ncbi:hypothetical protein B9Z55_024204 [Caenorhabditis nigoni]|uniref:Protein UBASH3A homolog n=1 Tax=Caenorhabditis nigoni TaxID=1611254 RepID=A0A2G5STF0_9PELO|nr:hypothetical protein B9Z55_024204 [Caenorhabditis nigoni]
MPERRVFVIRHGERCDFAFGKSGLWINSFDSKGRYRPLDINLPRTLPKRPDGWQGFAADTPLTEIGYLQSKLTGRALRDNGIEINHVLCSPALRCIQTTVGLLKGMGLDKRLQFSVEPGLYEWMVWARYARPCWIPPKDLKKLGYPVREDYVPCWTDKELKMSESMVDYYQRSFGSMNKILAEFPEGNILIVAHGASLETCTRQLVGGDIRSTDDFYYLLQNTPYLSCVELSSREGLWRLVGSPIPSFSHTYNRTFDPLQLVTKDLAGLKREREGKDNMRTTQ